MRLIILGGFLGSGKTTILNKYLQEIILNKDKDYRLSVIENDHGITDVDALILENKDVKVWKISGGCVCCTVTGNLIEAIHSIYDELHPDEILIELTGVAVPHQVRTNIVDYIKRPIEEIKVITVVDMSRFNILSRLMPPIYKEQCVDTDYLILNKMDSLHLTDSYIQEVRQVFDYMNPIRIWHPDIESWRF